MSSGVLILRELVLHVGAPKAGSTAIQGFLSRNSSVLRQLGVWSPRTLGLPNHTWAVVVASSRERNDPFIAKHGLRPSYPLEKKEKIISERWSRFVREVQGSPKDSTWCISSEYLSSSLGLPEVHRLRSLLAGLFGYIRVLLFVRDPMQSSISMWSTYVKMGRVVDKLPPPASFRYFCDYREIIDAWGGVFGMGSICIERFSSDRLFVSLLSVLGCSRDISRFDLAASRVNQRMSYFALRIVSRMNLLCIQRGLPLSGRRSLLARECTEAFSAMQPFVPSNAQILQYRSYYAVADEWLRSRFFPDQALMWPEHPCVSNGFSLGFEDDLQVVDAIAEVLVDRMAAG